MLGIEFYIADSTSRVLDHVWRLFFTNDLIVVGKVLNVMTMGERMDRGQLESDLCFIYSSGRLNLCEPQLLRMRAISFTRNCFVFQFKC